MTPLNASSICMTVGLIYRSYVPISFPPPPLFLPAGSDFHQPEYILMTRCRDVVVCFFRGHVFARSIV